MDENGEWALLERVAARADSGLPRPRLLLVFAHPDDEVLAVGGRLERMSDSYLITITDGAPLDGQDARHHGFLDLQSYREARQQELAAALSHAGLNQDLVLPFREQVPDQQGALHLVDLTLALAEHITALRPEAVLTHPYEGGHPDHDACAFAVHSAVQLTRGKGQAPGILESPFYHAGENGTMHTGSFLPMSERVPTKTVTLTELEQARKRERLACFTTQAETLAQFGVQQELFRIAPRYDFTQAPHSGQLLYERFQWGMAGEEFRVRASAALEALEQTRGRSTVDPRCSTVCVS